MGGALPICLQSAFVCFNYVSAFHSLASALAKTMNTVFGIPSDLTTNTLNSTLVQALELSGLSQFDVALYCAGSTPS